MKQTEQTLLEQMRITDFEINHRKDLLSFTQEDSKLLKDCRTVIESKVDSLVKKFYELQTNVTEIALLIGDVDTLHRLQHAQRRYVLDLFSGLYDLEYVNNRLRIGLVHKRIGVEPKLYLSAVHTLKTLLVETLSEALPTESERQATLTALDKLLFFDITLVFETYIRSLVSEIEVSKEQCERYASVLEAKVKERTQQLEELARLDSLTGLLNVRYLNETLTRMLRAAQRRSEVLSIIYLDVNDFKVINDTQGHQYGDDVLRAVGSTIKQFSRMEDGCFRYGGDEFCLILSNCSEEQAREMYVSRITSEIQKHFEAITLSVGIIQTGPHEYGEPDALIRQADERMYAMKKMRRNGTVSLTG